MVTRLKGLNKHLHTIEVVSGVILIIVGILFLTDRFPNSNAYFYSITPEFIFKLEENLRACWGYS